MPKLDAGKPELRYYPNEVQGQPKIEKSFTLSLDMESDDFSAITEEIMENF